MVTKEELRSKLEDLLNEYQSYSKEEQRNMNEDATRANFIDPLMKDVLGWSKRDIDYQTSIESLMPDGHMKRADYSYPKVPKLIIEAKRLSVPIDDGEFDNQVLDYAYSKAVNWAILTNFKSFRVWYVTRNKKTMFVRLNIVGGDINDVVDELFFFLNDNIFNGTLDKKAEIRGIKLQEIDITIDLAQSLNISRGKIDNYLRKKYGSIYSENDREELIQGIINRLIFIKKVEAEGLEQNKLEQVIRKEKSSVYEKVIAIFSYYREKYDSDIFGLPDEKSEVEKLEVEDHFTLELLKALSSPIDSDRAYNFAAMNVDVLGSIYENYLAYIQKGIKFAGGKVNRRGQGVFYTPKEIVGYIVNNTLGGILKYSKPNAIKHIKILDPACGSGSFIVDVMGKLNASYIKNIKDYNELSPNEKLDIIKDNIYAVDLDEKAVAIAKLNIYLELLTQKGQISIKAHRELLPELKSNIKVGNSLIDDTAVDKNNAFKWAEEFPTIFKNGGFDVIIGNPPYVSYNMKGGERMNDETFDFYKKSYAFLLNIKEKPRLNTMMFFVEKALKNLKPNGKLGFILNQNFLNINSFKEIRKYILDNAEIDIIVTDVEFPNVIADTFIIILTKKQPNPTHKIKWVPDILTPDVHKELLQASFLKNDDFAFITGSYDELLKKIENGTSPLDKVAFVRRGMQITKEDFLSNTANSQKYHKCISNDNLNRYSLVWPSKIQTEGIQRKKFIIFDKDLERSVNQRLIKSGSKTRIGVGKDDTRFNKEKLLVRQAPPQPLLCATFDAEKYYTDYTVHVINGKEIPLKLILAILNSKLMTFYAIQKKLLYSGKKRVPQIMAKKLKRLPIKSTKNSDTISKLVDKILSLNKQLIEFGDKRTSEREKLEKEVLKTDNEINDLVYQLYDITEEEKKIIEESIS